MHPKGRQNKPMISSPIFNPSWETTLHPYLNFMGKEGHRMHPRGGTID